MLALIVVLWLVLAGAAGYYYYYYSKQKSRDADENGEKKEGNMIGPVPMDNFVALFNRLSPESTHMDILLSILASEDVLTKATEELDKIGEMREKRRKQIQEEKAKSKPAVDFDDLVNADGWGDDEDDNEGEDEGNDMLKKAKEEEKRKEEELARLRKAQGKDLPPMEGLDEGVLGQKWVERTLQEHGAWPPELGAFGTELFDYKPKGAKRPQKLKPMDHPAFRRCLCMTTGRLHSAMLNAHPELVEAGSKKLVDETYFKSSMEFRQRIALILDATLRVAMSLQSVTLFSTVIETLAAFKVGCVPGDPKALPWFNGTMARQYNTLPRLDIGDLGFEALPEEGGTEQKADTPSVVLDILQAGQPAMIVLPVDRKHAEAFTKAKVEQCQKQNIPPQIALQGYREGWWFMVRWEPIDKDVKNAIDPLPSRKFLDELDSQVAARFENIHPAQRVRTAFPMMVQNIAQKSGAVKVKIVAPANPGSYKFFVIVKSQDFLGADLEKEVTIEVAGKASVDSSDTKKNK